MVKVSYLFHYVTLLENVTDIITKCDSYFITKCGKSSLQNVSGFLLQNATVLLQNATVTTKCDVYYKRVSTCVYIIILKCYPVIHIKLY